MWVCNFVTLLIIDSIFFMNESVDYTAVQYVFGKCNVYTVQYSIYDTFSAAQHLISYYRNYRKLGKSGADSQSI